MGGKAFKNLNIVRLNNKEFEKISNFIIKNLKKILNSNDVNTLPYYSDKPDFSDVDIMIKSEDVLLFEKENGVDFYNYCNDFFEGEGFSNNSANLTSIAIPLNSKKDKFVQLDLMPHNAVDYNKNLIFYGYNDISVLINRFLMSPIFDAKYISDGIEFNVYRDDKKDLHLGIAKTENKAYDVLGFLDLDIEKFKKGFKTKKEIFDFIIKSKYFDTDIFYSQIEHPNSNEKIRLKRDMYSSFITYIKEIKHIEGIIVKEPMKIILESFPELNVQRSSFLKEYEEWVLFKKKFNIKKVNSILNLDENNRVGGSIVKKFMNSRDYHKNKDFIELINSMSDDEVVKLIIKKGKELNEERKVSVKSKKRIF